MIFRTYNLLGVSGMQVVLGVHAFDKEQYVNPKMKPEGDVLSDAEAASIRITTGKTGGVRYGMSSLKGLNKSNYKVFTFGKTMANR